MDLYLVQHGKSKSKEEDPERSLTVEGTEEVERMAGYAAGIGVVPDLIVHSTKLRARQTAEIMAGAINPSEGMKELEGLAPMDDPTIAHGFIEGEEAALMLVGHLPHLSRLASLLITGDQENEVVTFRNSGIVALRRGDTGWSISWIAVPEIAIP
jgi:phosphohistidine phosphatase